MLWVACVVLLVAIMTIDYYERVAIHAKMKRIPIISQVPFVGTLLHLLFFGSDNLHLKFGEYCATYGKSFYARVLRQTVIVTADHYYVDELLKSPRHTRKNVIYGLLRPWLGDGLLLSTGQKWHRMRKIITPTFHFHILEQFVDTFDQQSRTLIEKMRHLADGATVVDVYPHMGLLTLDIITETAMGVNIDAQTCTESSFVQSVQKVTEILALRFMSGYLAMSFVFRFLAPRLHREQKQGILVMHSFTDRIIRVARRELKCKQQSSSEEESAAVEREMGIKKRMALLDVLLKSSTFEHPLSMAEIRDEVNTFMFEGHDTTTTATSFCLYLVSRHPECQAKLYDEIHGKFGDDLDRRITYKDLQDLPYLHCIVKETLRLYPPIPAIGRYLEEDLTLGDVTLPAGANVIVLLWQVLRDPEVFPEPEAFHPERHQESNAQMQAFSNIPFSAGPRNCIGQRFALLEMKTIVVQMLRHYELLTCGAPIQPTIKIVLRSKCGVNLALRPRFSTESTC